MIYVEGDITTLKKLERELTAYLESLTEGMGRPERRAAMTQYVTGLLRDGERKSIEPIAARLVADPSEVQAMRQRLQQCVVVSPWSAEAMFGRIARTLDRDLPGIDAFVVDEGPARALDDLADAAPDDLETHRGVFNVDPASPGSGRSRQREDDRH